MRFLALLFPKLVAHWREMGRPLTATPCQYYGCQWEPWSPYCRVVTDGPEYLASSPVVALEVGQRRHCTRCYDRQYRGVWFDAPIGETEKLPWE